ncbi:MAG: restriction endonuclease [Paramuribaculum sp.]|nr:restriction endonuclease [Paramuribaculum sp.]
MIDDEPSQAKALASKIKSVIQSSDVIYASDKEGIKDFVENKFYNLAVLDIRMDKFEFNGIDLAKQILEINPYAKILFVSKFITEYMTELMPLLTNGNVLGFSEKKVDYNSWGEELKSIILPYYEKLDENPEVTSTALINMYSELKDEEDKFKRGARFEDFISLFFQNIGFKDIRKRTRDKSLNEIDLIIRNEIEDPLLTKFGKYILIECKNHIDKIDKNDFIIFRSKLAETNGLAELGFFITTSSFKRTVYLEAIRTSGGDKKIIFIDNPIMMNLLKAIDPKEELKRVIDSQVKDN